MWKINSFLMETLCDESYILYLSVVYTHTQTKMMAMIDEQREDGQYGGHETFH